MIAKGLAPFAMLLALVSTALFAQTPAKHPAGQPTASPYPTQTQTPAKPDCNGVPCEEQMPRQIVTLPAPLPPGWPVHERILWAATLALTFVGYGGVMLALATLKKIERHTAALEASAGALEASAGAAAASASAATAAASAATEAAQAALLHAQAIVSAERPWILVTAEPTRGVESSFEITATNRGRSPATITSALDQVLFAADEKHLPEAPEFKEVPTSSRFVPIVLLPGESATLKTFSREDARGFCETDERFKSVESWEERLYLVGKVEYKDLLSPDGRDAHETRWCCWYIHGKQRSALVPAGAAGYNAHS